MLFGSEMGKSGVSRSQVGGVIPVDEADVAAAVPESIAQVA